MVQHPAFLTRHHVRSARSVDCIIQHRNRTRGAFTRGRKIANVRNGQKRKAKRLAATHDPNQGPTSDLIIDHPTALGLCLQALVDLAAAPRPSEVNAVFNHCNGFTTHRRAEQYEPPIAAQVGKPAILVLKSRRNASHYRNGHPFSASLNTAISLPIARRVTRVTFELVAGISNYGPSPDSGHLCSFYLARDSTWRYTNDA